MVYSVSGKAAFLWEVVIYWDDEWLSFHRRYLPEEVRDLCQRGRGESPGAVNVG